MFPTKSGRPYDPVYVTHRFQAALKKAELPVIPLHHLRHYFVSFAPQLGTHVAVASKRVRHASIKTTEDVYTGVLEEMEEQANAALERARQATGLLTGLQEAGNLRKLA